MKLARLALLSPLLLSCGSPDAHPSPPQAAVHHPCDAGDEAWARRAMLHLWGRRPHGAVEALAWADIARTHGRAAAADAMMSDPAWLSWTTQRLLDILEVPRSGDRVLPNCYNLTTRPPGPEVATWVRDQGPRRTAGPEPFTMGDLVASALVLDDVSVVYRAHLFARMARPGPVNNATPEQIEVQQRRELGLSFFSTYLHRTHDCLRCHNEDNAVNDRADPAEDRHWPLPGTPSEAVLGSVSGGSLADHHAVFRWTDLHASVDSGVQPWGMHPSCGSLRPPARVGKATGGHPFLGGDLGERGSVWTLEEVLHSGVEAVRGGLPDDTSAWSQAPDAAMAAMVASGFAGDLWSAIMGTPLVQAHGFSRNEHQRDRLQTLTDALLEGGWSIRAVTREVLLDPHFNLGRADTCTEGLAPMLDPLSVDADDPARHPNTPADAVRRIDPRLALRSVHDAMDWPRPPDFYAWTWEDSPAAEMMYQFGVFQSSAAPGAAGAGVSFEALLGFQAAYATCRPPRDLYRPVYEVCGVDMIDPQNTCDCGCSACVCDLMPSCCDEDGWDDTCAAACIEDCGGCGAETLDLDTRGDLIDTLVGVAQDQGATTADVVAALRDRVLGTPTLGDEESSRIEALLGVALTSSADNLAGDDEGLRQVCGAMLSSPQVLMSVLPEAAVELPRLDLTGDADCARAEARAADAGLAWACPPDRYALLVSTLP